MKRSIVFVVAAACLAGLTLFAESKPVTVNAWVLDSACAVTKGLKKPISAECAIACAKAGSPLALLDDKGNIYVPVSDAMPAASQNERLLPFAGQRVTVTGKLYLQNGTRGIVIDTIKPEEKK
jgi:hypothetical protein